LRRLLVSSITLLCLGASLLPANAAAPSEGRVVGSVKPAMRQSLPKGPDDVTVVATIDFNFVPYHWDFLASKMPQALDKNTSNDLPLDRPPHEWLPGFPTPGKAFKSYNRFDLTLDEKNPDTPLIGLDGQDKAEWDKVKKSTYDDVNYYWMPGTKVIGAVEFGPGKLHGTSQNHGMGVTSVSVGNIHGTCPECLLVFINLDNGNTADAIRWAMDQPWIDVISNSYGRGIAKVYNGPGLEESKVASERGQSVVFSAGNGVENAFTVTNSTYASAEKGPDWMITVGAVSPGADNPYGPAIGSEHSSFVGAGKPVDVAGLGLSYPSAYRADTVSGTGTSGFSGTSNAAPTIAGTYARALYLARLELDGPRVHALGHEPFEVRVDGPILGRHRVEARLRAPGRVGGPSRQQGLAERLLDREQHPGLLGRQIAREIPQERCLAQAPLVTVEHDSGRGGRCRVGPGQRRVVLVRVRRPGRDVDQGRDLRVDTGLGHDHAGE